MDSQAEFVSDITSNKPTPTCYACVPFASVTPAIPMGYLGRSIGCVPTGYCLGSPQGNAYPVRLTDQCEDSDWFLLACKRLAHDLDEGTRGLNVRAARGLSRCGMTHERYDTA